MTRFEKAWLLASVALIVIGCAGMAVLVLLERLHDWVG